MSMPTGKASARVGATASTSIGTPKTAAADDDVAHVDRLRRAVASAPTSDPTLMTENRIVNVVSVPPRSCGDEQRKTTWKLKASVPMTAIITSGIHRSGTLRT